MVSTGAGYGRHGAGADDTAVHLGHQPVMVLVFLFDPFQRVNELNTGGIDQRSRNFRLGNDSIQIGRIILANRSDKDAVNSRL
jgi:hypothetical protein